MSYSEALKQALAKGTNQTASGSKRQRSDGSTPDQPTKQMKGNSGHSSNYPTFRDALSTIRIAVLDAAFPEVVLTSSQLDSVKKAINEAIFSTEHSTPPNFNGCLYRAGYLVLLCLDQASANWLLQTAPTLRPWVGATLKAVDEKEVPRGKLIEGLFPDAAKISTEGLLKLITSQNPTCRVPLWRILERRNIGHAAKLVVSVDHTTYRALQAKGLKVSFGIEQVAFRPRSSYRKPPSRKRDTGQPGPGNATGQPASKHGKKTESKKRNVETSENPQRNKAQSTSAKKGPNLGPEERQKPTPVPTSNPKDSTSTPAGPSGKTLLFPFLVLGAPTWSSQAQIWTLHTITRLPWAWAQRARAPIMEMKDSTTIRTLRVLQSNLHHARAAADSVLCKLIYCSNKQRPRTAILLTTDLNHFVLTQFLTPDLAAVQLSLPQSEGGLDVVVASAYFDGTIDEIPPPEVAGLVAYCEKEKKQLIIGCDANAHHKIWGSSNINTRGESLLEFISTNNLQIINTGSKPTFVTKIRQEVLDITLSTRFISEHITNWHVSDYYSGSDHLQIRFDILATLHSVSRENRVPKLTDWNSYEHMVQSGIPGLHKPVCSVEGLEKGANDLTSLLISAYHDSCPVKTRKTNRDMPWWNRELQLLRSKVRKLWNRSKKTNDWAEYKTTLTRYNKELEKSKRRSWRNFTEDICSTTEAARLQKVLAKEPTIGPSSLENGPGNFTRDQKETNRLLLQTHFPGAILCAPESVNRPKWKHIPKQCKDRDRLSKTIFTIETVEWAINHSKPYKSPGPDGLFPALLQKAIPYSSAFIVRLFRLCFTLGHVPSVWSHARVVFIPKGGGKDPSSPKSYRPISLTSFLLKCMEKVIDLHLRQGILIEFPLHKTQHGYLSGRSTNTALSELIYAVEGSLEAKEVALCAFIDISGAFDSTKFDMVLEASRNKNINQFIIDWMMAMLKSRTVETGEGQDRVAARVTQGCPQGGVLSPLMWSLVIDGLLTELSENGIRATGYADDLVIIIRGKHDKIISSCMQHALNIISKWCQNAGLKINPSKTTLVPFTRRRKVNLDNILLEGTIIEIKQEVKYLGLMLDSKLTWNAHITYITNKAIKALWTCRKMVGQKWGLKPHIIVWIYESIVRPIIAYGCLVWWKKTQQTKATNQLQKVQRLACLAVTGAMRSCPTAAMEAILDIVPLQIFLQKTATQQGLAITMIKDLKPGNLTGHLEILKHLQNTPVEVGLHDLRIKRPLIGNKFKVAILNRQDALQHIDESKDHWYTDASKMECGCGIGIVGPDTYISLPLGADISVFEAEIMALVFCAAECGRKYTDSTTIKIFSDSQAALRALIAPICSSKLVLECRQELNELAERHQVILTWVPGHSNVGGNNTADSLAKSSAKTPFIGPMPTCGYSGSRIKHLLNEKATNEHKVHWAKQPGLRRAKLILEPDGKWRKEIQNLNKIQLRLLKFLAGSSNQELVDVSVPGNVAAAISRKRRRVAVTNGDRMDQVIEVMVDQQSKENERQKMDEKRLKMEEERLEIDRQNSQIMKVVADAANKITGALEKIFSKQ
ncbi:uncharacterized protein LOC129808685 [Phlebotomus papatasi]|uniref:uncharacterized protein LOC129808685 n=1 Tax=Phlebotomus papatasi TaxID=29031 RepID=UPI002483DD02|nr:uncharacterized protein LOC129808685 [Phlebotomus papatasi]